MQNMVQGEKHALSGMAQGKRMCWSIRDGTGGEDVLGHHQSWHRGERMC